MRSRFERAARALVPGIVVSLVLVASYLVPTHLTGINNASCTYTSPTPTVTAVSPISGTVNGGFNVTITGTQFCNGAVTVNFGATASPSVIVNSNTQITATTPAHAAGLVDVTVTTAGGTSATSSADNFTFVAENARCTAAGLTSDKASPQVVGAFITFTATSSPCLHPLYLFYLQRPGSGWSVVQNYGGPVWAWDTSMEPSIGNFVVNVWVTNAGSGEAVQINHTLAFTLTAPTPPPACAGAGLTSDKASPQQIDFTITFTATSTTCANPLYLFYLQSPGGAWTVVQGYGGPVFVWDTTGLASIGNYNVNVWVTNAGSGVAVQTNHIVPFTITNRVCTTAGLTANKTSPQVHGAVITFTATSAACARPTYLFYLKGPGVNGTWAVAQTYDGTTWVWDTSGVASIGTYEVNVWVTATGSGSPVQTNMVLFFTLT
jgi:IPT/TIG domain-containing protein